MNRCKDLTSEGPKACEGKGNDVFCTWNSQPQKPSIDIKVCTHTEDFSRSKSTVLKCSAIKGDKDCEATAGCQFNYPPEEPSRDKGVCTHSFKFNDDRKTVNACKVLKGDDCKANEKCVLNECVNDFGDDFHPCPS